MTKKIYLTIAQNTTNEIVIKKSRFICSLSRVKNEAAAKSFIEKIKANHRKATHNCFAYQIGDDDHIQRESDNGEPSGTAGVPILEALQLSHIHDVCAVVTRYFGGIKLGAGGLIRAYSNATSSAIQQAGIVQRVQQTLLTIEVPYRFHDQLLYLLKEKQIEVAKEDYGVNVTTTIFVNDSEVQTVQELLANHFNNQLTISNAGTRFHEIPYQP
ncbi:YigZ family protein [uncultured Limosilactobacillus sp.]|uniref:YigZ family protein n=1 Tax=uncultured Limosilactobacillus sp. TaxID=2837629 RepID=UPI0025F03736|nr:YigZ family protein [uncultured Limosilactobacillus sp.]